MDFRSYSTEGSELIADGQHPKYITFIIGLIDLDKFENKYLCIFIIID